MMTAPWCPCGVYDNRSETGKFHIGDELVICKGALGFAQLIEEHMGVEAADYFRELLNDLLDKAEEGERVHV